MIDSSHRLSVPVLKSIPVVDRGNQVCGENVVAREFVLLEYCPVVQVSTE
jgi:hypothetical protein